jgi:hypothetical protein
VISAIARFIYSTQSKQDVIEVVIDSKSKSITYFSSSSNPDPNSNSGVSPQPVTNFYINRIIVLVSGYVQFDKDILDLYLVKYYEFVRFVFADALKNELCSFYNFLDRPQLDTTDRKQVVFDFNGENKSMHKILIDHKAKKRVQDSWYWVKLVIERIKQKIRHN